MTPETEGLALAYLMSASLFIFGLKGLTHPATARRGNYCAMAGMLVALGTTLVNPAVRGHPLVIAALAGGAIFGTVLALNVRMTAVPQFVAAMHSFVGLAAVLVSIGTYLAPTSIGSSRTLRLSELSVGCLIGALTFTGSAVAFGKLQALLPGKPLVFHGQHLLNLGLGLVILALGADFILHDRFVSLLLLVLLASLLGVLLTLPIGGADMPVVVSMLNSYSGWTAAAMGFALANPLLIVTGALVGFSGAILSYIMSRAMNRSIGSIVLGGFGGDPGTGNILATGAGHGVKSAAVEDAVFLMDNASKVIVVPGYGMAVAQAQHALKELSDILEQKGTEVKFAIHPVAGRMPGHMNVLLAEADIPYDRVFELEEINPEFSATDVALIVGANDVTNPAAKTQKTSPIYGMPILEAYKARHVFFVKRSMKPGYAGIENSLFYENNCALILGDAKSVCEKMAMQLRSS